jgi:hypothetical protein
MAPTFEAVRKPCSHAVLVRVHTRCTAGDVFAADCHCRETLDESMRMIARRAAGRCCICTILRVDLRLSGWRSRRWHLSRAGRWHTRERHTNREPGGWFCTRSCGARGVAGADGTNPEGDRAGRADSVGPWDSADPAAFEYADAYSGPGRVWPGDRGAGRDSGGGMQPG